MKLTTIDILFALFFGTVALALIWEMIPDSFKKYWEYIRQLRKDQRKDRKIKYSFTWKR